MYLMELEDIKHMLDNGKIESAKMMIDALIIQMKIGK